MYKKIFVPVDDSAASLKALEDRISLLKPERVDAILASVTERKYRLVALATALNICKGDHALNNAELALFQHIMHQWQIDLTDLEIAVSQ